MPQARAAATDAHHHEVTRRADEPVLDPRVPIAGRGGDTPCVVIEAECAKVVEGTILCPDPAVVGERRSQDPPAQQPADHHRVRDVPPCPGSSQPPSDSRRCAAQVRPARDENQCRCDRREADPRRGDLNGRLRGCIDAGLEPDPVGPPPSGDRVWCSRPATTGIRSGVSSRRGIARPAPEYRSIADHQRRRARAWADPA